ncbi:lipid A biosynthesis acyltransferase, partial [Vibrio parahaemolyticus]|nr:lipid A biosynthesis acyltransferase [Vibrio parahaemolyticus]
DWRVKRLVTVVGKERILEQERNGRGVLVICSHHLNLEMTARIFSQFAKGYGVYRPNSNPAYEFIQHRGRTRCGHQMIDRKDVKSMLKVLKNGQRLWYLPDHDYGVNNSVFAPFFAVEQAASTAGSSVLIDATKCAVMSGVTVMNDNRYTLYIGEDLSGQFERRNPVKAASILNQEIEGMIKRDIPAWMWLHKRFKTRPEGLQCVYS